MATLAARRPFPFNKIKKRYANIQEGYLVLALHVLLFVVHSFEQLLPTGHMERDFGSTNTCMGCGLWVVCLCVA